MDYFLNYLLTTVLIVMFFIGVLLFGVRFFGRLFGRGRHFRALFDKAPNSCRGRVPVSFMMRAVCLRCCESLTPVFAPNEPGSESNAIIEDYSCSVCGASVRVVREWVVREYADFVTLVRNSRTLNRGD